jgi:hypothetical protein
VDEDPDMRCMDPVDVLAVLKLKADAAERPEL